MLLVLLLVIVVARSLVRPLRRLRDSALKVAHEDLARELERVRAGGEPGPVVPIPVHTSEEVGQVAHAVDELHEQAVFLAGEQSRLQLQVSDMFETLSRRSRSLVDQQLSLIDRLERNEEDPERLESLFRLDHLAARMRRNGANLLVLAGAKVPREQAEPVPVAAIINAAASEVEDYTRVVTATVPDSEIRGVVAGDLVHLLAELLDNALRYSPPISQVRVSAVHTGNGGLVIEVSDIGLGMADSDLRVANTRLQSGGEVNPYTARHMGLFVVGRLATQHGLVVRLRSTIAGEPNSGTTAGVYLPGELLLHAGGFDEFDGQDYGTPADAHAGIATALALDEDHADFAVDQMGGQEYLNGHSELPVTLLPQRDPGASGISDVPTSLAPPVAEDPTGVARGGALARRLDARADARACAVGAAGATAAHRHLRVLRVARPSGRQRCAEPATRQRAGAGSGAGRARAVTPRGARTVGDGRIGRCDLPEDAVRMARRSARPGQQHRPELGVGVGSRLVGCRGRGGSARCRAHRGGPAGARARGPAGAGH